MHDTVPLPDMTSTPPPPTPSAGPSPSHPPAASAPAGPPALSPASAASGCADAPGTGFLDVRPDALADSAHRLRGLAAFGGSPVSSVAGAVPVEAFASAVPGVGRFLAAVDVATATQSARVTELAGYAGSAAAALDWMAGAVTGTDGLSSAALDGMMPA